MIIGKCIKQSALSNTEHTYRPVNKFAAQRYIYAPVLLFAPQRQTSVPLCSLCLYRLNLWSKSFTMNYFLVAKYYKKATAKERKAIPA